MVTSPDLDRKGTVQKKKKTQHNRETESLAVDISNGDISLL